MVCRLSEARLLDRRLFQTLITVVKGPSLQLLLALNGNAQRYTYGIIALWKHTELGANNRRTAAMSAMQAVKFQGDAEQWKMQVMAASREIYASGATIEHAMMGCLLSSFQGKSPQVQSMMVNEINSDKVGPGIMKRRLPPVRWSCFLKAYGTRFSLRVPSWSVREFHSQLSHRPGWSSLTSSLNGILLNTQIEFAGSKSIIL